MIITNEHKTTFIAFGFLIQHERETLLENHTFKEIKELCEDVNKYISPLIDDDTDLINPVIDSLRKMIEQVKKEQE